MVFATSFTLRFANLKFMDSSGGILPADLYDPNLIYAAACDALMLTVTLAPADTAAMVRSIFSTNASLFNDMPASWIVLAEFYRKCSDDRLLPLAKESEGA
jgi:hypothetical protein